MKLFQQKIEFDCILGSVLEKQTIFQGGERVCFTFTLPEFVDLECVTKLAKVYCKSSPIRMTEVPMLLRAKSYPRIETDRKIYHYTNFFAKYEIYRCDPKISIEQGNLYKKKHAA